MAEKDESFQDFVLGLFAVGLICCGFFWVSSCQRTDIIKSCLENLKTVECIKK